MFNAGFTFDSMPRSPSLDSSNASSTSNTSPLISPCSSPTSADYPFPRYTVSDLAVTFSSQRIRSESQIYYDSCEAYAATDDDAGWQLDPLPAHSSDYLSAPRARAFVQPRSSSPSQRSHRQANSRLLCSMAHHKDIAALVARMVESKDQCSVVPPDSLDQSLSAADIVAGSDDEGYDSSDAMTTPSQSRRSSLLASRNRLEYRRSSDMKAIAGACVNKAVRLRKAAKHRRLRNPEIESK